MRAKSGKKNPPVGSVRVKILPKDPLVAREKGLWPKDVDMKCCTPGDGPTGPRAVVVQIAGCGHAPTLNTPEQYALIERFLSA